MNSKLSVKQILLKLNEKLLALTSRNKLLSSSFTTRSEAFFFIDELPQKLAEKLSSSRMEFAPLPPLETEPQDEKTKKFQNRLSELKLTDEIYLKEIEDLQQKEIQDQDEIANLELKYLRSLKDRLRIEFGMKPIAKSDSDSDLRLHAKNFGLDPTYNLPDPSDSSVDINAKKFNDKKIQTLFLVEALNARLRKLKSKERTNIEETGLNTLYVSFGFLEWQEVKSSKKRLAPLILMPINFDDDRKSFKISSQDGEMIDNLTLRLFLKNDFSLTLPNFPKLTADEDLIDIEKYLLKVDRYVSKQKGWRVLRRSSIGIFYTQELTMYEDIKEIAEEPNDLLKELFSGEGVDSATEIYDIDNEIDYQVPSLIESADASQYSAVIDAMNNKNFVLRGPPGTGKSQTICNMIAAGISNGKRILFIADKEAALEVVRSRLAAAGLDKFTMKAYSTKSAKKPFWESVKNRFKLGRINHNQSEYEVTLDKLKKTRDQLNEYKNFISKEFGKSGQTVHDLLWEQQILEERFSIDKIDKEFKNFPLQSPEHYSIHNLQENIDDLLKIEEAFSKKYNNHVWESIKSVPTTTLDQKRFREDVNNWKITLKNLIKSIDESDLVKQNKNLISSEKKFNKLIKLVDTICKYNDVDYKNDLVLFVIKSDNNSCKNLIELLNTNQKRLEIEKDISNNGIDVNNLEKIIAVGTDCSRYLSSADNFSKLSSIEQSVKELLDHYKSASSMLEDNQFVSFSDFKILSNIKKTLEEFKINFRSSIHLNPENFEKEFVLNLQDFKDHIQSVNIMKKDGLNFDGITESKEFYKKSALYLKNSSFFSIFSSEYWNINKFIKFINFNKKSKEQKVKALEFCSNYIENKRSIYNNSKIKNLFKYDRSLENIEENKIDQVIEFCMRISSLNISKNMNNDLLKLFKSDTSNFFELIEDKVLPNYEFSEELRSIIDDNLTIGDVIIKLNKDMSHINELFNDVTKFNLSDFNFEFINSKILSFNDYLKILSRLESDLKPKFKLYEKIILSNNQDLIEDLISINDNDSSIKKYIHNNLNDLKTISDKLVEIYELYRNSNEKLKQILIFVSADPFRKEIDEIDIDDQLVFANQDTKNEDNIIKYFEFRFLISNLNEMTKIFYNTFVSSENFTTIKDMNKYFKTWVRYNQYKSLVSDKKNAKILQKYKGKKIESLKLELKELDERIVALTRAHVAKKAKILQRDAPVGNSSNRVSEKTELELLQYGVERKTFPRGSVRDHIFRTADALSAYCPCWMMTPSNVSTFIPREEIFDIVIIDEASQMTPPRAIGAIRRASQMIIVGDENQLPPTSFFSKADDTQEDDLDIDVNESILDLAMTKYRNPRMLQWHYRSKHEDLIRFQNYFIYDSKLIVPPSIVGSESEEFGVKNHYLPNAIYQEGGINNDEADKIIEILLNHAIKSPDKSVGIAVMNNKQMELVEQKKNIEMSKSIALSDFVDDWAIRDEGLNKFFIKNLERVQGDERDVIIVGTVYGKLKGQTRPFQRFPTINTSMGHRRLNVITTRARDQIHLVTSLQGSDIIHPNTKGTKFLSEYLSYSITKKIVESDDSVGLPDSPFEEWAIAQVESLGFQAVPQVGVKGFKIDIGVKHPNAAGYIMGIECDGASYHSSASARDRDLLRQQLLEAYGWNIYRIWSTDWIWEPGETREKLKIALNEALKMNTIH